MKRILLLVFVLFAVSKAVVFAQTPISPFAWTATPASYTSSAGPSAFTVVPATTTPGASVVNVSLWNRGSGVSSAVATATYNSNNWQLGSTLAAAQAASKFVFFTITNDGNTELQVTRVYIYSQISATGPQSVQMMYAVGAGADQYFGSTTALTTVHDATPEPLDFAGRARVCPGETVVFKLYGWGGTTAAGTLRINDNTYITATYVTGPVVATATASTPVCENSPITFTSSGSAGLAPYRYSWAGPSSYSTTTQNPTITSAALTSSGIYTVTVSDSFGCTDTALRSVTVNPQPTFTVTPTGAINLCAGGSQTINIVPPVLNFQWYQGATAIAGATGSSYTATTAGTYSVIGTSTTTGCSDTSAGTIITIIPTPVATITPTGAISLCGGQSRNLTTALAGGRSYQWFKDGSVIAGATNNIYNANSSGVFSVRVTITASGCSDSGASVANITVHAEPATTATAGGPTTFCSGNSVVLTQNITTGSSDGPFTYQWRNGSVNIPGATNSSYTATTSGNYRVVTTTVFGCDDTTAPTGPGIFVTVNASPAAAITAATSLTFCTGGSVVLSATPTGGVYNYQWFDGGTPITGATGVTYTATATGNITVRVTNGITGCNNTSANTVVTEVAVPFITAGGPLTFCEGNSVTLTVSISSAATGVVYQWRRNGTNIPGANTNSYSAVTSGDYTCFVNIPGSCTITTSGVTVLVHPAPNPIVTFNGTRFSVTSGFATYQWYLNMTTIPGATSTTLTPTVNGSYRVRVTDTFSCATLTGGYMLGNLAVGNINNADAISIYPNPATNVVHVEGAVNVSAIITSMEGKTVLQTANTKDIDITALSGGLYIISLYNEQGNRVLVQKLMKQ